MRIDAAPQHRREIEQLQAHGQHDPRDREAGPGRPAALGVLVLCPRVPAPEHVLDQAAGDVGRHVVRVVPAPQLQVRDVARVQQQAQKRPGAQDGPAPRGGPVQSEVVHHGVVEPVEHVEAGAQVVQLFGELEIARMEDAAKQPARDADVGQGDVEGAQGVRGRDGGADLAQARHVGPEVRGGEEDGQGFLDAEEAGEGPFAVELDDGEGAGLAGGGDDVLAGVVAFGGAVPEEEAEMEGCDEEVVSLVGACLSWKKGLQGEEVDDCSRIGVCDVPGLQFSCLQICARRWTSQSVSSLPCASRSFLSFLLYSFFFV